MGPPSCKSGLVGPLAPRVQLCSPVLCVRLPAPAWLSSAGKTTAFFSFFPQFRWNYHDIQLTILFIYFMATSAAYGSSGGGGWSSQSCSCGPSPSHSNTGFEPHLNYTAACGNTGSLTHWGRLGIEPTSSQRQCLVLNPLSHNRNSKINHFEANDSVAFNAFIVLCSHCL